MSSYNPKIKADLFKIINYSLRNKLKSLKLSWEKNKCMTIVLCSKGYPGKYKKNKIIEFKKIVDKKIICYSCRYKEY